MVSRTTAEGITLVALAIAPLMGAYALLGLDRFRRQAFGRYKKGAAALMFAVFFGLVYYIFVVALQWRNGSIEESYTDPLGTTGLMLIAQSVAAAITLLAVALGARSFLTIVEPE